MFEFWEEYRNRQTKEDLLTMIDLALLTQDEEWFHELVERLERVER